MGNIFEDNLSSAADEARKRWHAARNKAVAEAQNDYERGRQAYADAIRAGRDVVAGTTQQVRNLGSSLNAGVRSMGNAVSLGLADNADAATGALLGAGGSGDFASRYHNELALQHAMDAQGARDHPVATQVGNVVGAVGGILAADSPAVAGVVARLFPNGAKAFSAVQGAKRIGFVPEGLGTMAAVGGGAVGGIGQVANDAAHGRATSLRDFAGAVGGGALAGERAVRWGPAGGAAAGGAATGLIQGDSPDEVIRGATASAYMGGPLGAFGVQASNALPRAVKGGLGEGLSFAKSLARGERIPFPDASDSIAVAHNFPKSLGQAGPQQIVPLSKSYTKADFLTAWGRAVEAKFGFSAGLTRSQRRAVGELGPLYLVDHWHPGDIGDFAGGWFGPAAGQWSSEDGGPQ